MAKIETYFDCDLKKAVQVQPLNGNVFSLDNNGNRIGVRIFDNGVKTTVTGTVTGRAILADNSTVNLNGGLTTVNGQSVAYVDVLQGALLIPGTIKITIQLTASGVITTLAAILSTVYQTKTDNVITPSAQVIADWNATISSAIQTQNAAIAAETAAREAADSDLKSASDYSPISSRSYFVPAGQTHQKTSDPIYVDILEGEPYYVMWNVGTCAIVYKDGTQITPTVQPYIGVAEKDIDYFGIYFYNNTGSDKEAKLTVIKNPVLADYLKDVENIKAEVPTIQSDIDDINESIDDIVVNTEMPVSSVYSGILEKYAGYISSSNYAPVSSEGYDTYSFKIEKECNVYFDGSHGASYISIIGYDSTTFNQWHDVTSFLRYKENEEDTLPYSGNKMNIPANTYIAVTVNKDADFYLYGTELIFSKSLNPDISIPSQSTINKIRVIKKGETIKVYQKSNVASNRYTRYTFKRATIPARAYDSWKLWSIDIVDSSETIQYSLENGGETECEGAIYETGKSDYIGGYHGDEYYTDINCIIDGKIYDLSSDFSVDCMELTITVVSYLNHCDTQTKVFNRVKTLTWTFEKISIMNYYKAVDSINIGAAAIGLLSAYKKNDDVTKINKMKCNWKGSIENIPTNNVSPYGTTIDENVAFTKGELMGSNVYISAQIKNFEKTAHNSYGRFTDFVERMKIYLYPISDYEMQSGDYFVCTADYVVMAVE